KKMSLYGNNIWLFVVHWVVGPELVFVLEDPPCDCVAFASIETKLDHITDAEKKGYAQHIQQMHRKEREEEPFNSTKLVALLSVNEYGYGHFGKELDRYMPT
ncbi:hypothetical protein ACJX0J_020249, partial [Zea mays]